MVLLVKHETFMEIAKAISKESKCVRLEVGAVLVKDDRIISTGYNGTPKGYVNCCDHTGIAIPVEEHHHWSQKYEIHAEMNAILYCPVPINGSVIYVTDSPCFNCTKHLIAAGVTSIYYGRLYDRYLKELSHEWQEVIEFCEEMKVKLIKIGE